MKIKILSIVQLATLVFLFSCNPQESKIDSETYLKFQSRGATVSNISQVALLTNVKKAMGEGGPVYAVEFCNAQASSIIDSLNVVNDCTISRVSDKNRNPGNRLNGTQEEEIWDGFASNSLADTLIRHNENLIYYKRITIALPACLKCHGNAGAEINTATHEKLQTLYPNDLATGYKLNDFRGLWKIEFKTH